MKLLKKLQIIPIILIIFFLVSTNVALSQSSPVQTNSIKSQADAFRSSSKYTEVSGAEGVSDIIARVMFIALSLLAVIFIILTIIAGYQWMTAGGNEEQVTKAKKNISNAVIGLIIVLSAYALTWFIFTYLPMSAGTGGGGEPGGTTG